MKLLTSTAIGIAIVHADIVKHQSMGEQSSDPIWFSSPAILSVILNETAGGITDFESDSSFNEYLNAVQEVALEFLSVVNTIIASKEGHPSDVLSNLALQLGDKSNLVDLDVIDAPASPYENSNLVNTSKILVIDSSRNVTSNLTHNFR